MIESKKLGLAAAVVLALFANGALAQQFSQDSEPVLVPEELFGASPVKLEFNEFKVDDGMTADVDEGDVPFVPKAKLILQLPALAVRGADNTSPTALTIAAGTEFSVTFTVHSATFAESVASEDLMWGMWDGTDFTSASDEVSVAREGGAKGSNSVTYEVTVAGEDGIADLDDTRVGADGMADAGGALDTRKLVFLVPDLNASGLRADADGPGALDQGGDVLVSATVTQETTGGGKTTIREGIAMSNMCGENVLHMSTDVTVGCPVVEAVQVLPAKGGIMASMGGGTISLASGHMRKVLVGADGKALDPQRIALSAVSVNPAPSFGGARDQDGDLVAGFSGDLSGNLAITVSSDSFRDGDTVYIDADGDKKIGDREAFDMSNGTASDTVALAAGSHTVYYVPNGEDALTHRTSFAIDARTEFGDTNNKTRAAAPATATLTLQGIKQTAAKAYAIAPIASTDIANVRVTCESSKKVGCNVFLDCKDQDGMNTFGDAGMMVGPGMTVRWNQMDVAMALGLEDGWEGRLACDVLSSDEITVQVLTRAAGVLVNNTAVSTGGTD